MTSNTDGAAQGEWHEGFQPNGQRGDFKFICECTDGYHTGMVTNDRILDDHRKAQTADVLVKALERLVPYKDSNVIVNAALAQFNAATETQKGPGARRQGDDAAGAGG